MWDADAKHNVRLTLCSAPPPPPPPQTDLRCGGDPAAVQARALLLIGIPSSPNSKGRKRRDAIRAAWMADPLVQSAVVVVCFLLSADTPEPTLAELEAERTRHRDMLLVDAPETGWIIQRATAYSNGTKLGRGMPTFKQHRFFQIASSRWPRVRATGNPNSRVADRHSDRPTP